MIWLPRTTDNSTFFAQSLEIRGIESRLYIVLSLKNVFILAISVNPDDMLHNAAFHLGLHCLLKY